MIQKTGQEALWVNKTSNLCLFNVKKKKKTVCLSDDVHNMSNAQNNHLILFQTLSILNKSLLQ